MLGIEDAKISASMMKNNELESIPSKIFEYELLKDDGIFILEHSKTNSFTRHPFFKEERKYGSVHFSFFPKSGATE